MRDCPAAQAGLQLGDVVVGINGQPVTHPSDIDFVNWDLFIGDTAEIVVDRAGEVKRFKVDIIELMPPGA
jgi:S1-C subfamily serine protease